MLLLRPAAALLQLQTFKYSPALSPSFLFPFVYNTHTAQKLFSRQLLQRRASASFASSARKPQFNMACAQVVLIPTLADNYAYLLIDRLTKTAACVDPAEPEKVIAAAEKHGVTLRTCLCTHKHLDHSGGNMRLKELIPSIEIVGSAYEDTPGRTKAVCDGDTFRIGDLQVKVLHAPCHTSGHILYYMESRSDVNSSPIIFTGDTLFLGGCGRFFEGDAAQMHEALIKKIGSLAAETLVYCGHEYSVSNLEFAASIDPHNAALQNKLEWAKRQRANGRATIPSSIGEEKAYNPFMRVDKTEIQKAVGAPPGDAVQTMHILRERKNVFRG